MDTTTSMIQLLGGIALLVAGAEVLVRAASMFGLRLGMRPLTVGATIVAFGTSAPEFLVSVVAGIQGEPGIALGNLLGSNVANIGLVLGLAAIIRPFPVSRRDLRIEASFVLLATALLPLMALDRTVQRWEGWGLLGLFVAFLSLYVIRPQRDASTAKAEAPETSGSVTANIFFILLGLGMLIFGSDLVIDGAIGLAEAFGLPRAAVAATVVAVGTSLPEVTTSVVAALKGQHDLVIGNVLGSNVFNLLFVLGPAAIFSGHGLPVGEFEVERLIPLLAVMTVTLGVFMYTRSTLSRLEGSMLLLLYGVFLYLI